MQATDLEVVRDVVKTLEALPPVFLDGLPGSVVGTGGLLLAAALEDAHTAAEKAFEEAATAAEAATKELDTVMAAADEAAAAVETASAEAEVAETASKVATKKAKEAVQEHKSTQKAMEGNTKKWAAKREQRARAESIFQGSFKLLEVGGWEDEEAKAASVQAVEEYMQQISAEKILIAAVPSAVGTKPDDRKPLDKTVVEAAEAVLAKHLAEVDAAVKQAEPEEREAKAELLGIWALSEVASEEAQQAKEKSCLANAEWTAAESRLTSSRKRLLEVEAVSTETAQKKARAEARRVELENGRAAVERLKSAPAAEESAPAPAAEAPAAEAAEAAPSTAVS